MDAELIRKLHDMRPQIRMRWEVLLRIERLHTPLANPDTLVYMFDQTLDSILAELPGKPRRSAGPKPTCQFENNPMRVYFTALEQALLEALVHAQSAQPKPEPGQHSQAVSKRTAAAMELSATVRRIARREIKAYDEIYQSQSLKQRA
jgi:hypothetical protein